MGLVSSSLNKGEDVGSIHGPPVTQTKTLYHPWLVNLRTSAQELEIIALIICSLPSALALAYFYHKVEWLNIFLLKV